MPQYLPLPDGNSVTIREGETPEQAWARAQEMYPESFGIRPAAKPSRGNGLSDIATAFKQGAVGSTKALTDIFGAENAASTALDKTSEELQKDYSTGRQAELKAQAERMKRAEQSGSLWEEIKAGAQNVAEAPLQAAAQGVGSFVPYLPTMFVGPIAGALRLAKPTILALEGLAGSAQKLIGTAQGAGAVKGSIYDAVYEKEVQAGVDPEVAKQKAVAAQEYLGKNWEQIALGGALGRVAAGSGVEKLLTKQGAEAATDKLGRRVGQAVLQEGLTEAPQGGQERLAANLALQRAGYDTPLFEGVAGAATQEGLTGGLSAAPIAAIRGPKAAAQPVQQDELQKLRDEEEQRLAEERKQKETPDYAKKVVEEYDFLAKQKQDLIAQIKKIPKDSPTADADKAFNKEITAQIKEIEQQLKPLAQDYHKSKGKLKEIERQAALAKMPVEDFMLQQMGMEVKPVKPRKEDEPVVRRGKGQLFGVEETPPVEDTALQDYAQGQFEAARGAGVFDLGDTADYMMQDPTKAAEMVKTRTPVPGLSEKDSNTVLSGIKMRLAAIEKGERAASKQELAQRQETLKSQTLTQPTDQMAMFKESQEDVEEQRRTAEPNFDYLDPMFEKALDREPVIKVSEKVKPIARGPQIQKQLDSLIDEVDRADQDYRTARYAMPAQGKRGAPERAAAMEALTKGKTALAKIEQLSKEGGDYAREVVAARRQQQEAMAQLSDITEQLRTEQTLGGANKEMAASTEQSLANKSEQVRGQLISSALQEAALNRRAAGQPAITQDEAIKAASVMYDAVNDWVARANAKPEKTTQYDLTPVRERINRSGQTVTTYRLYDEETNGPVELTFIRQKDGTIFRIFSRYLDGKGGGSEFDTKYGKDVPNQQIIQGAFLEPEIFSLGKENPAFTGDINKLAKLSEAEVKHFQERIKSAMRSLLEKPDVKATRVETGPLKRQFAAEEAKKTAEAKGETATTLGGELRRRKEYTTNLIDKALSRRDVPENIRNGLERAKTMIEDDVADKRLLDAAENQAERVLRGQDLGQVTRMGREQVDAGRQVVRNVPGKEGSTEIGRRGQKSVTTGTLETAAQEKAAFPKGAPVAVEANEALRELEEAMALNKRVAQEDAGQKSLFPDIQEDLGYIRATPKNFANSPRMKPVWAAIDRAKALFKKTEPVRLAKEATRRNRMRLLEQLTERMDSIRKDTQFFWKDTSRWSDAEMAKVFAGMPEAGTTQEEKNTLYKYAKGQPMSPQERAQAESLLKTFREQELPKYAKRVKEAMDLLAQGRRLQDADNQLLSFMQDTNANVKATAKALSERMAGMRNTIEYLKEVMRGSAILSPEQKALIEASNNVEKQRGVYQDAVAEKFKSQRRDMEAARNALLDPQIGVVSKELEAAKKSLDKEQAELNKIKKRFDSVLAQKEGANRTELATYELFRYEEKKGIIDDLKAKIKEQEDALEELVTERHEEFDGAAVAIETMLDSTVKMERQYLEMQEATLAAMRGETVLDNPNAYPFAYRQAMKNLEVQKKTVQAAEQRVTEFKEIAKSEQQQMEEYWKDKLGGKGVKRQAGTTEVLKDTAEKEADRLRTQEQDKADRAYEAEQATLIKNAQAESIDKEVAELITELGAYEEFPNELSALKKLAQDETLPQAERDAALAKAGVIQNIESLEQQREVLLEGKPRKKQRAATVASTIALAAQKPLRTGYRKALESASEGLAAEREGGVYGEFGDDQLDLRGLFRTTGEGEGMTVDEVQKIADAVRKDWEVVPPIVVIQSETGLPIRIYRQLVAEKMEGKAPGLYDPKTKKVYLIADNLHGTNDVALTVAHEIAGHFGLREMLGDTYADTMQSIYDGNEAVRTAADGKMDANRALTREVAVEEVLADMAETGPYANSQVANALRRIYSAIKQWFLNKLDIANISDSEVKQLVADARRFVKTGKGARGGNVDTSGVLYRSKAEYKNEEFENVRATMQKVVAQNKTWWDKVKANTTGLAFETQLVDRFAGFERLAKYMDKLAGTQMLYYLRTYDQRMNIVSKAVADGAPVIKEITRKDGRIERVVETSGGANIASIVNKLREAQPFIGNGEAVNQVFTTYMAAIRAKNKGIETLNFGTDKDGKPVLTQEMLDKVTTLVENNKPLRDVFEAARKEYNQYNRDMLDFVASTGALSKTLVKRLVAQDDYIPFYRERKGVVELVIGNESPIRIGSIADQPYLQELVGGDTAILDFMTSSVQNTNMLVDMGMRNLATKNAVMELVDLKAATLVKKADGPDVVKFKVDGDDRYAIIATEKVTIGSKEFETGVPADILVKGMEGIPTQMPFLLRAMALPAQGLRKAITLSPVYMARQLFRDSLAAPILSGADFIPIIGAVKEINSATKQTLEKRGITGGQQFKGTSEDLSKILRDISDGKPGWMKALGALEATSMELDAATRRAQYNSYIEQGLSEMEATLMALESMNFNKRGASPSIHVANALIPFFNAQIQGLNVMYKAMAGKMPFNDQLRIREKMLMRGGMMAAATFLYAMMMQDDEAYKNATPDQKYGNWFIRVPGLDEPLKLPIPFEIGYIFKAIPEALYNSMTQKHGGEEAVQAFNQILIQTLPGGSSMPTIDIGGGLKIPTLIPLPQAVKPVVETALEKSFYTGRDILSEREKKLLPEQQFRNNTSEAAKLVGSALGLSPIKMEALVSGYTGTMGLAFLHAISLGVPAKETPEQAVKRLSEYPILGGVFQPNDAGGIINSVYMRLNEDERVRSTVRTLFNEGKAQEAQALLTKRGAEYMEAELGDKFKANMNKLTQAERAIAASNLSAEAKRAQLDDIRKLKIALANMTREISDKTIRLSGFS